MATATKPTQESVKQAKQKAAAALGTQAFLQIAEIRDNTVVLKNGGLRGILRVSSINFNLKSEEEQNAIIYSYQGFLNTLEFPIQIVVQSKKLDIDNYLEKLKKRGEKQKNPLLQRQTLEYVEYIAKLVEYADIMEKEFFVVVPCDPYRAQNLNVFQKFFQKMKPKDTYESVKKRRDEFDELRKKLLQRLNVVRIGLENCGLKVEDLTTSQLIELFYSLYNPVLSRYQKLKNFDQERIVTDEEKKYMDEIS